MSAPKNPVTCKGCNTSARHTQMICRTLTPTLAVKCCPNCNRVVLVKSRSAWLKVKA